MFALFFQIAAVFMHLPNPSEHYSSDAVLFVLLIFYLAVLSRSTRIAAYYLMATTFYVVIW